MLAAKASSPKLSKMRTLRLSFTAKQGQYLAFIYNYT